MTLKLFANGYSACFKLLPCFKILKGSNDVAAWSLLTVLLLVIPLLLSADLLVGAAVVATIS